jgi:DNA-binding GntR family transcriptional regulator
MPVASHAAERASLDQIVYDALFDDMLAGRLRPGERLAEVQLCAQFGVSRTVVRQALRRLAELRVVDIVPNKGAAVAAPSPREALEVFEARRAVEAAVIGRLAREIGHTDLERLRQRLRAEHAALHHQDQPRWAHLAGGFHLALAQMAGNSVLLRLLTELLTRCTLIVALYEPPGNAHCEHEEHEQLVDLLALRDADGAQRLMDAHLGGLLARLRLPP